MKTNLWFKKRRYCHFDWPIKSLNSILSKITTPEEVIRWSFYPFLKIQVKSKKFRSGKVNDKIRPIMYACHADAHLYAYYADILSKRYEEKVKKEGIGSNIIAFRKLNKKCNINFAKDAFDAISAFGECCVLAFDIEKFFDSIDHACLKEKWAQVVGTHQLPDDHYKIYKSLTKFSFVERDKLIRTLKLSKYGKRPIRFCTSQIFREVVRKNKLIETNKCAFAIPQGSPISGVISNIALLDFDIKINAETLARSAKYYRYCDDILIICDMGDNIYFKNLVRDELSALNLKTNDKTKEHKFYYDGEFLKADSAVQYLGFMFDGVRAYIRSSSISKFDSKMKKKISQFKKTRDKNNAKLVASGQPQRGLFMKTLLSRCTHLGRRNFIRYGLRASNIFGSKTIKRQIAKLNRKFCRLTK